MEEIKINKDLIQYDSCPKSVKPMICKYCGGKYYELNIYSTEKCCSYTCRTRQRRIDNLKKDIEPVESQLKMLKRQLEKLEKEKHTIREKTKREYEYELDRIRERLK